MATAVQSDVPSSRQSHRILPLHLSAFEDYMVWDDRPEYPMTFVVQMEFDGQIDRRAMEEALTLALQRHPLLQAIVQPAKGRRDCWSMRRSERGDRLERSGRAHRVADGRGD
ncbi:MAG: hypothetical protein R3C05_12470 [Pirellulaceae bacterium]